LVNASYAAAPRRHRRYRDSRDLFLDWLYEVLSAALHRLLRLLGGARYVFEAMAERFEDRSAASITADEA
jgi:hypothetical protein